MNRLGRIPLLILLGGALLLPFGVAAYAQDAQGNAPTDKDSKKKNAAKAKDLKKLQKELATP